MLFYSRNIVIQDFSIGIIYYTIQNIWKKETGKLNFVIIDVNFERYRL